MSVQHDADIVNLLGSFGQDHPAERGAFECSCEQRLKGSGRTLRL
jgi:hypothetical protein